MDFSKFKLISLANRLVSLFKLHLYALFTHLDAVQAVRKWPLGQIYQESLKVNYQFVIGLIVFIASFSDSIFGLEYEHTSTVVLVDLAESPYIVLHQMIQRVVWYQTDMILLGTSAVVVMVFSTFWYNCDLPEKCKLYPVNGGRNLKINSKVLPEKVSIKIMETSRKLRILVRVVSMLFQILIVYIYCYFNIFFKNAIYRVSAHSAWVFAVMMPIYIFYIIHVVLSMVIFIIMSSTYLQIWQKSHLGKLIKINYELESRKRKRFRLQTLWRKYLIVNTSIFRVCASVKEYSRFWAPFLSIMFPYYIFVQCYLLYCAAFARRISYEHKWIYSMVYLEMVALFFLVIRQCAAVVKYNDRILVENRRFFHGYYRLMLQEKNQRLHYHQLLKAENLQIARRLHSYSFRLYNNSRITSKTFHVIISYISIFFMSIYKTN